MSTDNKTNDITLIKISKQEAKERKEKQKREKEEKLRKVPEKDRERKKKYQAAIIKTSILFALAVLVLGLLVVRVISSGVGITCLIAIAVLSTFITRKNN